MAAFIQDEKVPVNKDWFTMVVSRGIILLEHSNCKTVGVRSRTHVLGDICFMNFNSFFGDPLKSTHGCTRELSLPKTVGRGMNNLVVNGIMDLVNLIDKEVRKDLWNLISCVGRRWWGGCNLA